MDRQEELRIHALGAAISRRDWHAVEVAHAAIRDAAHAAQPPALELPEDWGGFSGCGITQIRGSRKDIDLVQRWCNQAATIPTLQQRIRELQSPSQLTGAQLEQASRVMPLIGPMLDALDGMSNDERASLRNEHFGFYQKLRALVDAVEAE